MILFCKKYAWAFFFLVTVISQPTQAMEEQDDSCDFVGGKWIGKRILKLPNGNSYEGDFVNDQRTGKGVFTWANGNSYEGGFVNGQQTRGILKLMYKKSASSI